jgi:hypothetical protein
MSSSAAAAAATAASRRRLLCEEHVHGSADTTLLYICIGVIAGVCFLAILVALYMRRRVRHLEMQLRELFTKVRRCRLTRDPKPETLNLNPKPLGWSRLTL